MSSRPTIFLDLDGVIVDFNLPVMKYHRAVLDSEAKYPSGYLWDIVGATNSVRQDRGYDPLTPSQFWDALPFSFWKKLKPYEYAHHFIEMLDAIGTVYIATTPTKSTSSLAGKYSWIKSNLHASFRERFFIGRPKHLLANPDAILIDDNDANCRDFRYYGGRAILVPRAWNEKGHLADGHPYDHVMDELRDMLGIKQCN
jgi:5'(3')-deoxyribonucleotidase